MRFYLSFLISIFTFAAFAGNMDGETDEHKCLSIHHTYLDEAFFLTKNCVGFTAPVSGRAYGYFAVGMYESTVEMIPELNSVTHQLQDYERETYKKSDEKLNWMLVVNEADYLLLSYLYRNMPPSNEVHLNKIHDSIAKQYRGCKKRVRDNSLMYAQKIVREIIEWSKLDGADTGFENNYPESFTPPSCDSCWTKTFPGYLPSLLPYWGTNRQMLKQSDQVAGDMERFEFSVDSNSVLYQEALRVLENSRDTDPKNEIIAEFWDDAAGYSGTPSGHFFKIAKQVAVQEDISLDKAMELYVKLGVAVNEAFISAFKLKYQFNFIRPITYIQRYIEPQFNTRLASPPFPEYPSGHSFQSGAATEVMKSVFGDELIIVDSTNYSRNDIDGSPRVFKSFTRMAEEISISRFYGGIHFVLTLDRSLSYGRLIGQYVATTLKCRD